jgi:hypothetical protein
MTETNSAASPWNKGKITGPKPPLRPSHAGQYVPSWVWRSATATWQCSTLAIDSKLRGCVARSTVVFSHVTIGTQDLMNSRHFIR